MLSACAEPYVDPDNGRPLDPELRDVPTAALLDDAHKRGGRGRSPWQATAYESRWMAERMSREPPAPPLQDHVCAAFEGAPDLIDIKVASDPTPDPVPLMIPAAYFTPGDARRRAGPGVDGIVDFTFWHHDLAPYGLWRQIFSLQKEPMDYVSVLLSGGRLVVDGEVVQDEGQRLFELYISRILPEAVIGPERDRPITSDLPNLTYEPSLGLWRVPTNPNAYHDPKGTFLAFDQNGTLTDYIDCKAGPGGGNCGHEMKLRYLQPRVTYDHELLAGWRQFKADTATFLDCAAKAHDQTTTEGAYR